MHGKPKKIRVRTSFPALILLAIMLIIPALQAGAQEAAKIPLSYSKDLEGEPEGFWPEKKLKEAFMRYWRLRSAGRAKESFLLEAPFFQEMIPKGRYVELFSRAGGNELLDMQIRGLENRTEYLYTIICSKKFKTEDGRTKVIHLRDEWTKAGGEWYHVTRDRILFPETAGG